MASHFTTTSALDSHDSFDADGHESAEEEQYMSNPRSVVGCCCHTLVEDRAGDNNNAAPTVSLV